jgi:hypothetical protein
LKSTVEGIHLDDHLLRLGREILDGKAIWERVSLLGVTRKKRR